MPCLPPGDLPNPGIEPVSLTSPALAAELFTTSTTCLNTYKDNRMCWEANLSLEYNDLLENSGTDTEQVFNLSKTFLNSVKWKIIVPIKGNFAKKTKGENVNK